MLKKSKKTGLYQDKAGKWRWRTVGENGEITGASSQGFCSPAEARVNANRVRLALTGATL